MSLEKSIISGKEHRNNYEYNFAKRVSPECRNHGGCIWCEGNRRYQDEKSKEKCKEELKEYKKNLTKDYKDITI